MAVVDENTGEVVLGDIEGTATITATFAGNDAYKPGTAEYTITLTKLDAGLAYAETSFEVRVESEFTAPTLTNPNGLTVTYSSSDENVALVDVNSGEVVIGEAGQATITATFAGNTKYNTATAEYTITVIAGKLNAELALNQESLSMNAGTTKALSALYTITSDGQVSFASSDEDYVTISDGKLIAVQPTTEAVTVTISVAETEDYAAASVELPVTVTVLADVAAFAPGSGFTKVTSTEDIVNGEYLIVNETAGVAFDGGLKLLDAASNVISVTITDGTIAETDATKAATFTINVTAGTLKSSSGWYIGKSAYSNGLDTDNAEEHELTNTFSIEEGNAIITAFGGVTLRYNKASDQNRFRYYKSGQQDIQLYRLESSALSIGSAQWRTLVSSANLQFPEKVKAYIVTSSSDEAKLTRVRRVKAGVPVVLNAPEGSYSVTVIDEANCEDTEANLLQVSVQNTTDAYVLANKSQGVGFYKWTGGWMGAGRVYLPLNSANPAGVRTFMPFNLDESTTIVGSMAVGRLDSDAVYNLNGQRVAKPAKGLYIVGGKKVFIK